MHNNQKIENLPKIRRRPGHLPAFWNRSAVYVANILALFFGNQDETEDLRDTVGTIESYGGRLVPILNLLFQGRQNLLVLEREPVAPLLNYFEKDLKLRLPEIHIAPKLIYQTIPKPHENIPSELEAFLKHIAKFPAEWIDGFVVDQNLERIAEGCEKRLISSPQGSRRGNNKYLLHQYLSNQNLPLFDTQIAHEASDLEKCLDELQLLGYRQAVVKAQVGASGIGMQRVDLPFIQSIPDYLFYEGPCLVQGWLDETLPGVHILGSPSVQIFVGEDTVDLYDLTEQILSRESVHEGNIAPPPSLAGEEESQNELFRQAGIGAQWLYEQGYRGTASADFHIIERDGQIEIRLCEINARITGATYPALLARYFKPDGAWVMRNVRFNTLPSSQEILDSLERHGLCFQPNDASGIIPINLNPKNDNSIAKGQFLALGNTVEECEEVFKQISAIESIPGDYDRD